MKNFTKTVATFALVAAVTVSLGSAPALAAENPAPFRTGEHPAFSVRAGNDRRNWKPCEMTEEEKAARIENFKAKLAEKLASGEITQEKYDEVTANIESGNFMSGKLNFNGISGEKVRNFKLPEGGMPVQPENFKAKLAEKLAAGEITQEKYDEIIANMESGNFPPIKGSDGSVKPKFPKMPIK